MGFLGLIPFTTAAAVYDPAKQVLTVSAEGEAQKITYGIFFKRVPWMGGLRFELYGWTGPLSPGTEPFEFSQQFKVPNLHISSPSGTLILVGSNHPGGKTIEIKWTGFKPPVPNGQILPKIQDKISSDVAPAPQILDVETPETINTLYKEPFTISERVSSGLGATLHMDFDPQFLMLTRAGIDGGDLVWMFNSLETGVTQVVTYSTEGLGEPVIRKVHTVNVFVLDSAARRDQTTAGSNGAISGSITVEANGQNGKLNGATKAGAILGFLGRVFEAQRIAQAALPSARLLRVQATLPAGPFYPVTDPLRLSQLDVLFTGGGGAGEYVTVRSTGWGEWAPPVIRKGEPVLGLQVFAVEDCKVDITRAGEAVRAEVGAEAFFEVTLARPFGNPSDGPYDPLYTFQMVDTSLISVNAVIGKIVGK
ncbi:hypothetical protein Daus18300_013952 [Diaporthe australafricana]|uniref:Uncharacterized protein n=1 Tax=Diaporthe australafricana TaxID=127596 RepID=A0ABR3VX36_9PEZI